MLNRQRGERVDRLGMEEFLRRAAGWLRPPGDFTVVLLSNRAIRRYNRDYRGQDKPTDVLAFPADHGQSGDAYLGDILISVEMARAQSGRSASLTFEANLRRLALHGLLHLMGYDHETDSGEMRAFERRLRHRFQC